jgi:predicted dehydrogenase
MASTDEESEQMIDACKKADRKLMIAYRLRYEPNTIAAIDLCRGGQVGKPKIIQAIHSFNIAPNQWRLDKKLAGGGPLVDLGIYCLNAARYLTGEEPTEITASMTQPKDDPRFKEVEESLVFTLRFPSGCLANCSTSYAHAYNARTTVFLEKATLDIDSAFAYRGVSLRTKPEMTHPPLPQINQFAAELDHFSDCILSNKPPRTPGEEGLQDMKHIQAIYRAAEAAK